MEIGSYLLCLTGVLAMGASRADAIAAAPTACAYDKDAMLALDEPALLDARTRLAAVEYPADMGSPPVDGFIELPTQPGQPPMRVR